MKVLSMIVNYRRSDFDQYYQTLVEAFEVVLSRGYTGELYTPVIVPPTPVA